MLIPVVKRNREVAVLGRRHDMHVEMEHLGLYFVNDECRSPNILRDVFNDRVSEWCLAGGRVTGFEWLIVLSIHSPYAATLTIE